MDPNLKAFIDLLVDLTWPAVVVFGLIYFKGGIAGLLAGISNLKWFGGARAALQPLDLQSPSAEAVTAAIVESAMHGSQTAGAAKEEAEHFKRFYLFENSYNVAFGSQIKFLEQMKLLGPVGWSAQGVKGYYDKMTKELWIGVDAWPVEQYLSFFQIRGFIEYVNEARYRITPLGLDFLDYLNQRSYSKHKPF